MWSLIHRFSKLIIVLLVWLQLFATVFTIEAVPSERQDPVFRSEDIHILRMMRKS